MQAHKVTDFKSSKDATEFFRALQDGIQKRKKEYESNRLQWTFGPIKVIVWSLDMKGATAFAQERHSLPRMTEMALFLNEGACIACRELDLKFLDLGGTDKTIPSQAKEIINESFRTVEPHASINPD